MDLPLMVAWAAAGVHHLSMCSKQLMPIARYQVCVSRLETELLLSRQSPPLPGGSGWWLQVGTLQFDEPCRFDRQQQDPRDSLCVHEV